MLKVTPYPCEHVITKLPTWRTFIYVYLRTYVCMYVCMYVWRTCARANTFHEVDRSVEENDSLDTGCISG